MRGELGSRAFVSLRSRRRLILSWSLTTNLSDHSFFCFILFRILVARLIASIWIASIFPFSYRWRCKLIWCCEVTRSSFVTLLSCGSVTGLLLTICDFARILCTNCCSFWIIDSTSSFNKEVRYSFNSELSGLVFYVSLFVNLIFYFYSSFLKLATSFAFSIASLISTLLVFGENNVDRIFFVLFGFDKIIGVIIRWKYVN